MGRVRLNLQILKYSKIIIWSMVIAYLCFAPADEFKKVHISIPHFDKVVHFGMFFILGLLIGALSFFKPLKFNVLVLPIGAILYGGLIELVQLFFIYKRDGDWFDWLADIIGLLIGVWIIRFIPDTLKKILA